MSHVVADCFEIENRVTSGYFADLVVVDMNKPYTVAKENILLYKCGWSPLENFFPSIEKQWLW